MTEVTLYQTLTMPARWGRIFDAPAIGFVFILLLLAVWELCARLIPGFSAYLPAVSTIASTSWSMILSGELPTHGAFTVKRLFIAYFYAVLIGLLFGMLIGHFRTLYQICEPTLELLRPAPAIAIIPIAMLVFGLDDRMKISVTAWGVFWVVFLNAIDGVRSVDVVLLDTARAYGYRGWRLLWRVVLPAALPYMMAGLRLGLTISLTLGIFVEVFTGGDGVGHLLQHYNDTIRIPEMYAAVFFIAVLGFALHGGFELVEARVIGWHLKSRAAV
jgi:ABC-type nitrate/sulfonate/bicarbonate transport system permease component